MNVFDQIPKAKKVDEDEEEKPKKKGDPGQYLDLLASINTTVAMKIH